MSILTAVNNIAALNQTKSNTVDKKPTDVIGATGKNYSVFANDANNRQTNYFAPENLGMNLATNLQDYVKKNGSLDNLQRIELAPALTDKQKGNGFADNIKNAADDYTINATTRYLSDPKNKEALTKMSELFGIEEPDYKKLEEAMIKANKDNDMTITRDEIDAYKKSQIADKKRPNKPESNKDESSQLLTVLKKLLSFLSLNKQCGQTPQSQINPNQNNQRMNGGFQNLPYYPNQQMGGYQNLPYFPNQQMGCYQNVPYYQNQQMGGYQNSPFNFQPNQNYSGQTPMYYPQQTMPSYNTGNSGQFIQPNQMSTTQKILSGLFNLVTLFQ